LTAFNSPLLVASFSCGAVCLSILDEVTSFRVSIVEVMPFELPVMILVTVSFGMDVRLDSQSCWTLS
jgi:hypothetical protein